MIQKHTSTIGEVANMANLIEFKLDESTKPGYDYLENVVFTSNPKVLNIEQAISKFGKLDSKGVSSTEPFSYQIEGEAINSVRVVRYETDYPSKPGLHGSIVTIYVEHELFDEGAVLSGPTDQDQMYIVKKNGQVGELYSYDVKKFGPIPYISTYALANDKEWVFNFGASSQEFSVKGPGVVFIGAYSRMAYWNSIRVSSTIGGETAGQQVTVYDIEMPKEINGKSTGKLGGKKVQFFTLAVEEALRDLYNNSKHNLTFHGIYNGNEKKIDIDKNTHQYLRTADGLDRQRSKANEVYTNVMDIDLLIELVTTRAAMTGEGTNGKYLVKTAMKGFHIATTQLAERYSKYITTNITPGQDNLTAGFAFTSLRLPSGHLITFTYDPELDNPTFNRRMVGTGHYATSYEWHVYNIGNNKSGRGSVIHRYHKDKNDIFRAFTGVRDAVGHTVTSGILPRTKAKLPLATNEEDAYSFTMLGDFTSVSTDPNGSFVIKPAYYNNY